MTKKPKKIEPQFGLDMPFDEALERFINADPKEVEASVERSKQKKSPGSSPKRKPTRDTNQPETVVRLRSRRNRKRNTGR